MSTPRVILVIESYDRRGLGTHNDPVRMVRQYHTLSGEFLCEDQDPYAPLPEPPKDDTP